MSSQETDRSTPGVVVVKVAGDIDMYSTQDFQKSIATELEAGALKLVLDFAEVDYLDSSGVGAIIRMLQKAKEKNAAIVMCGLHGTPLKVLQLSNILALIVHFPARAEAINYLG